MWADSSRKLADLDADFMSSDERITVADEIAMLERLRTESQHNPGSARKRSAADYHQKSRRRGRGPRPPSE